MITVYTKDKCPPCNAVKRALTEAGVEFTEKSAMEHIDYLAGLGYRQAPVTVISEDKHFYGYDPNKLQQIIAGS